MGRAILGEFLGTAMLVLIGNGVVANVLLRKSKAEGSGWMVIATGWALGVMTGVFTALACGGEGHLNPAVTLGAAIVTGDFSKLAPYAAAQLAGAMAGACLVWLNYLMHWKLTPDADAKRACFCTSPAVRHPLANLTSEMIGTFVLVLAAAAISSKAVAANGLAAGLGPYLVGSLVWAIGLGLGGATGYAINPARDLGPRIVHAFLPILKKEGSDWAYAPVPIVGPVLGASIAGLLVRFLHF